jgi:hypothetical protein
MKRFKKYWFYLLLALSISLTILVINDINDNLIPQIIQDINSGVIGAILTTIITLILLSNQNESQENLTKNSVVYEEKLKVFNFFLETLSQCLDDGKLTAAETTKIINSFSILRIHITKQNAAKIENSISSIDNSFFYYDENSVPNLTKLIGLYTEITNVFKEELYGENKFENLKVFEFENLKKVLYRQRTSIYKPNTFLELLDELKNHSKIIHTSNKTGITIVYDINIELIDALNSLHNFMKNILSQISEDIVFSFEIKSQLINNEKFCSIPWIKLFYNEIYFGYYRLTETKKLMIGKMIPEELKQVASLEIFEIDTIDKYKPQIKDEFKKILENINDKYKKINTDVI